MWEDLCVGRLTSATKTTFPSSESVSLSLRLVDERVAKSLGVLEHGEMPQKLLLVTTMPKTSPCVVLLIFLAPKSDLVTDIPLLVYS